jgi:hypothetical protein
MYTAVEGNWFLWIVHDGILDPKHTFLPMKLSSSWVSMPGFRAVGIGAVLNWDMLLKYTFLIRRLVCSVLLLLHKQKDLYFFKVYASFEIVARFRSLGATVIGQNLIKVKVKSRLNLGNACYHSVQNILSCWLLSKNIKIRIYKTSKYHPWYIS